MVLAEYVKVSGKRRTEQNRQDEKLKSNVANQCSLQQRSLVSFSMGSKKEAIGPSAVIQFDPLSKCR
ncbi:hypothetical protein SynPROS91_02545 [Synechococcus sp. PROS-9-1]|nr:hypothetical protein SynPROS91_02545 [Synechococcus sp. PROS-9-1]